MLDAPQVPPRLMKVDEVAEMLNISRSKVFELMKYHGLPTIYLGKALRFMPESVWQWLESYQNITNTTDETA